MLVRLLTLLTILSLSSHLYGQWISVGHDDTPIRAGLGVIKVMAPSSEVVWAVTFDTQNLTPTPTFLRSTDGLETIMAASITTDDPSLTALDIFAFDGQTAWAAMTSEPCQCYGQLYRTTNGGQSWTKMLAENSPQSFIGIYFWTTEEGIAIAGNGTGQSTDHLQFWRTQDGGLTWSNQTPADLLPGEHLRFGSANGHYAVVADHIWIGSSEGRVWYSADRGGNWQSSSVEDGRTINTIAFKNEREGLAGSTITSRGGPATNQLWRTSDGGISWEPLAVPRDPALFSLQYVTGTPDTYTFTGGYTESGMAVSTTGGAYWTDIPASRLIGTTYLSPTVAYAGGLLKSDNRGGLYRLVSSFEPDHVHVTTLAGSGIEGSALGLATQSDLFNPDGMVYDSLGQLYIANDYNNSVLRLTLNDRLEIVSGSNNFFPGDRDTSALAAEFYRVVDLDLLPDGRLAIADMLNHKVKVLDLSQEPPMVTTLAGTGLPGNTDGLTTEASFQNVASLAVDPNGAIIVGTSTSIRKISTDSVVTTLAGSSMAGDRDGQGADAAFNLLWDLEVDSSGQVYVADIFNHKIRKVSPQGQVTTVAGTGEMGNRNGPANEATFSFPEGVAVAPDGRVFVGDGVNGHIRLIDTSGMVSVLAGQAHGAYGNGFLGFPGPQVINGDGQWAHLSRSRSLLYTPQNSLLHSEWGTDLIRELHLGVPSSPLQFTIAPERSLFTYPLSQLNAPFQFSAEAFNFSAHPVSEVQLRVRVYDGTRLRYIAHTAPVSIDELDVGDFILEETFMPTAAGRYRVEYDLLVENTRLERLTEYLHISDSIMAYDDQGYYLFGSYSDFLEDAEDGYGQSYTLSNADTLTGLRYFGYLPANTPVLLEVYELGDNGGLTLVASHEIASVTDQEPGASGTFTLPFPALALAPGTYLFTLQAEGMIPTFDNGVLQNNYFLRASEWTTTQEAFGGDDLSLMIGLILGNSNLVVSVQEFPYSPLHAEAFPNPFTESVQVRLPETAAVQVYLYDSNGRILKRASFVGDTYQLNALTALPAGAYTLLLESGTSRQAIKLLKR